MPLIDHTNGDSHDWLPINPATSISGPWFHVAGADGGTDHRRALHRHGGTQLPAVSCDPARQQRQRRLSASHQSDPLYRHHARVRTNLAPRNGKDWRSGWRIFVKHDNNTDSDFQAGDILITEHASLPDSLAITTTVRAAIIAYQSTGTNTAGSWLFEEAEQQRLIAINLIGRVRSCRPGVDPGCSLPPGLTRSARPAN